MRIYLRALAYFRADWFFLLAQQALVSVVTGVNLLAAWPLALLVDTVLSPTVPRNNSIAAHIAERMLPSSAAGQIVVLALSVVAFRMLGDAFVAAQSAVANHVNWRGTRRVRADLYRALRRLGPSYYTDGKRPAGDALYRFTLDTLGPQQVLIAVTAAAVASVTVVSVVAVLLSRHAGLTIASLAVFPVLMLINRTWGPRLAERMVAIKSQEAELGAHIHNATTVCDRLLLRKASYPRSTRATVACWWRHARAQMAYNWLVGATQGIGAAVVFGYGGWLVHSGTAGLTIGDLTLFLAYVGQLWGPLATITGLNAALAGGASGSRRVFEILDSAKETAATPTEPVGVHVDRKAA